MSGRKRKRHLFESNPALRKRHCSKLLRRLKETLEELSTRVGLQVRVVAMVRVVAILVLHKSIEHIHTEIAYFNTFLLHLLSRHVLLLTDHLLNKKSLMLLIKCLDHLH